MENTKLVECLHSDVCEVVFTKTDGTERRMNCTLKTSLLPEGSRALLSEESKKNPNVIPVWDTDSNSWKSFRIDSVSSFRKVSTYLNG
jgi:hypothetical protein